MFGKAAAWPDLNDSLKWGVRLLTDAPLFLPHQDGLFLAVGTDSCKGKFRGCSLPLQLLTSISQTLSWKSRAWRAFNTFWLMMTKAYRCPEMPEA